MQRKIREKQNFVAILVFILSSYYIVLNIFLYNMAISIINKSLGCCQKKSHLAPSSGCYSNEMPKFSIFENFQTMFALI